MDRNDLIIAADDQTSVEPGSGAFMFVGRTASAPASILPAHAVVPDPEAGWASRNPDRAMLFLYVSPRDCAAVDELLAA